MKQMGLVLLFTVSFLMISSGDAFAGGSEYDNRVNAFWFQFYVGIVAIAGIMVAIGIVGYKIGKRRAISKNL